MAPPKNTETLSLLEWINSLIPKINEMKDNKEKQKEFRDELLNIDSIIGLYENSTIIFKSRKEKTSDFVYSIDNNSFVTKVPLYVTFADNIMYVSLDSQNWVVFRFSPNPMPMPNNNPNKPENFKADYIVSSSLNKEKNAIEIDYTISFTPTNTMQTVKLSDKKPIYSLTKDMVLVDKNSNLLTIDFKKNILYIPKDTIFVGNLHVKGNIFKSENKSNIASLTVLQDIFVYLGNMMLSVSFDKVNWGLTIFSFNFSPNLKITSVADKKIQFDLFVELSYKE
ncbi:MAG: hypothetical protein A2086_06985 [Spirochaetes bacterium GWD1_27_9]|nr:MAG: hypothetical protein A2Z98_05810 [Spirochaetes bacterium GWB1_27_13]OHD35659.1 MAG: hypothetical protein A2086_06985 [Spirochaetes bacterium GWD1_27_9]